MSQANENPSANKNEEQLHKTLSKI